MDDVHPCFLPREKSLIGLRNMIFHFAKYQVLTLYVLCAIIKMVISMKKYLLYDDNAVSVGELKKLLEEALADIEHKIFTASVMKDADRILESEKIDIAFLDIVLENGSGINYAVNIQKRFPSLQVVFVTGYVVYSEQIFDAQPSGFLVKPVTLNKIQRVLNQLDINDNNRNDVSDVLVYSTKESGVMSIPFSEAGYFEYSHRKIHIYKPNGTFIGAFTSSIGDFESKLPSYYCRCHYSYWINLSLIKEICRYKAITVNGVDVPISQNSFMRTREAYIKYLTKKI